MSFSNVTTLTRKLESLPEEVRERVAEYLSEHFEEIKDEVCWDGQFKNLPINWRKWRDKPKRKSPKAKPQKWIMGNIDDYF